MREGLFTSDMNTVAVDEIAYLDLRISPRCLRGTAKGGRPTYFSQKPTRANLAMRHGGLLHGFARLEGCVMLVDLVPVEHVPPGGEIFRATVVVFQVVGVLPDVVAEDGIEAL